MHSVLGYIRGCVSRAWPRSQTRGRDPEPSPDCGGEGSVQQKALLRAGVLREPCVGPPTAAGAGGSDGAYPLQRDWAGQREPRPPNKALLRSAPPAAKECRPRAGEQRPGEGPASKEQAAAAGGGPWPPRRAADTVRNSSGPGGRWDCLEPLPDQLLSQPQAAPSPRSHPPRRGAQRPAAGRP